MEILEILLGDSLSELMLLSDTDFYWFSAGLNWTLNGHLSYNRPLGASETSSQHQFHPVSAPQDPPGPPGIIMGAVFGKKLNLFGFIWGLSGAYLVLFELI